MANSTFSAVCATGRSFGPCGWLQKKPPQAPAGRGAAARIDAAAAAVIRPSATPGRRGSRLMSGEVSNGRARPLPRPRTGTARCVTDSLWKPDSAVAIASSTARRGERMDRQACATSRQTPGEKRVGADRRARGSPKVASHAQTGSALVCGRRVARRGGERRWRRAGRNPDGHAAALGRAGAAAGVHPVRAADELGARLAGAGRETDGLPGAGGQRSPQAGARPGRRLGLEEGGFGESINVRYGGPTPLGAPARLLDGAGLGQRAIDPRRSPARAGGRWALYDEEWEGQWIGRPAARSQRRTGATPAIARSPICARASPWPGRWQRARLYASGVRRLRDQHQWPARRRRRAGPRLHRLREAGAVPDLRRDRAGAARRQRDRSGGGRRLVHRRAWRAGRGPAAPSRPG